MASRRYSLCRMRVARESALRRLEALAGEAEDVSDVRRGLVWEIFIP